MNGTFSVLLLNINPYKNKLFLFRDIVSEISFMAMHLFTLPLLDENILPEEFLSFVGLGIIIFACVILLS